MWRILYFAQLAGQYGLFGTLIEKKFFETLFHFQTNSSRFVEYISLMAGDKK